jgi:hypothetical protein
MEIAMITYQDQGKYASGIENEDEILVKFLRSKGLDVTLKIWTDTEVNWPSYQLAILKSPWDYFDKIQVFYQWLTNLEKLQVRLLNPYSIVRWNSDKHYLDDIARAGLPVIASQFIEKGHSPELVSYFEILQTEKLIVKPCISGGAKHTFPVTFNNVNEKTNLLHELLQHESFIVQPFMPQIQSQGEWSFIFFNGMFSHSLLKKAKPGDFRVQHYLGGSIHTPYPPSYLLETASAYIDKFASNCLYARVDGVEKDNQFLLMELELIEPFLFLFTNPESYTNYYNALVQLL